MSEKVFKNCVKKLTKMQKVCQKWDLNPRPHSWTRILIHLNARSESWVWRLRPLGHPDMLWIAIATSLYALTFTQGCTEAYCTVCCQEWKDFSTNSNSEGTEKLHFRFLETPTWTLSVFHQTCWAIFQGKQLVRVSEWNREFGWTKRWKTFQNLSENKESWSDLIQDISQKCI